jgi:hypothetical protein
MSQPRCGTPILARRVGALPKIIRDGRDGSFGDDVEQLTFLHDRVGEPDRAAIRGSVLERSSETRMVDRYEGPVPRADQAARRAGWVGPRTRDPQPAAGRADQRRQ